MGVLKLSGWKKAGREYRTMQVEQWTVKQAKSGGSQRDGLF